MPGKILTITHNDTTYRLQYNRRTIATMEQSGFLIGEVIEKPATRILQMFHGAFQMHHKGIRRELTDEIYLALPEKEGLIDALVELYNEPLSALLDDPASTEGTEKNASWVMG
jgi:hypothetical protein